MRGANDSVALLAVRRNDVLQTPGFGGAGLVVHNFPLALCIGRRYPYARFKARDAATLRGAPNASLKS